MNLRSCAREIELSEVLKAGHWPDACDANLRKHASTCQRCADYVLLALAFKASRAEAVVHANLDHPSLLYWRARLRRRNQALEQLNRPTYFVGSFAFLSALLLAVGFLFWQRRYVSGWFDWIRAVPHSSPFRMETLSSPPSNWSLSMLIGCLGALLLFTAVALYLASDEN